MQKRCSIASIKYTYRRQVSTQLQMMEGAAINSGPLRLFIGKSEVYFPWLSSVMDVLSS